MEQVIPTFGVRSDTLPQKTRACAYAVITNGEGQVAAVLEDGRIFLPGGGIELSETPAEAVHREVREELGRRVTLVEYIGQSIQYFHSNGHCLALYATFYAGELLEEISPVHEHELAWVRPEDLFHAHHAWAATKALATQPQR